jgi:hypothetical protein
VRQEQLLALGSRDAGAVVGDDNAHDAVRPVVLGLRSIAPRRSMA